MTLDSMHNKRLAIDLNIFYRGEYTGTMPVRRTVRLLTPIGDYWKGLDRSNIWGGDWKGFPDPLHFERTL